MIGDFRKVRVPFGHHVGQCIIGTRLALLHIVSSFEGINPVTRRHADSESINLV